MPSVKDKAINHDAIVVSHLWYPILHLPQGTFFEVIQQIFVSLSVGRGLLHDMKIVNLVNPPGWMV
jgi:hypothetical protein